MSHRVIKSSTNTCDLHIHLNIWTKHKKNTSCKYLDKWSSAKTESVGIGTGPNSCISPEDGVHRTSGPHCFLQVVLTAELNDFQLPLSECNG